MKFVCSNCKAKYQIADEKAAGRTLRMTCRRCNNEIVIQGSPAPGGTGARRDPRLDRAAPPPPAAASPLAADFRRQVASGGDLTSSLVSDEWHVAINDIPVGPMRRDEVARKIAIGAVTLESLAWREGLDDWMPAADIAELAMLFGAQLQAPPPPAEMRPAARSRVVPVGGRVGVEASPAVIEDIEIPQQANDPFERMSSSGTIPAQTMPPPPNDGQNAGRMFMLMCGGVFVMFVGVLIGVKVLTPEPVAPVVQAPVATTGEPAPAKGDSVEEETDNVIALDLQEIDGELAAQTKAKAAADATKKPTPTSNGKQLTAAEQALLDQMSGGGATANIKTRPATTSQANTGGGEGLSASQLSAVVNKKRNELQRCYESALRATASDETVRLDVDITVGVSGTVTRVATRGKALTGMAVCIERTVRLWRFPTASGETRTSFPVVFQPGG